MKVINFVPIPRKKSGTLGEFEATCFCGCNTKFMKKRISSQSLQTKHFLNIEHYRAWWTAEKNKRFIDHNLNNVIRVKF